MGSIDIINPLFTALGIVVNKSQQHQEKISWEHRELNLGLLGEKQESLCYAALPPPPSHPSLIDLA